METASDSPPDTPKKRTFLFWSAIVVIAILLILSIGVMTLPSVECFFMGLTGTNSKLELLKFIGWIISGLIAIFGVIGLFQRAEALEKQNIINEKNHKQRADEIEKGQAQERFKAATEHLGSERISVRIAAFYEFYHLAEMKLVWQESIFNILCAHLRQTTKNEDDSKEDTKKIKPTEEVQTLLAILFTRRNNNDTIFDGLIAPLKGANLQGADLRKAPLQGAILQGANLQGADLEEAFLQKAFLQRADLRGADLRGAKLQGASLQKAEINADTSMPNGWKDIVKKDKDGKTGVLVVDDQEKIIERL